MYRYFPGFLPIPVLRFLFPPTTAVVICFLSTAAVGPCLAASWPRQPEVRLLDGYKSPLDEGFPGEEDYYGGSSAEQLPAGEDVAGGGGGGGAAGDDGPEIDIGKKEIPLCQRECMSKFSEAAKLAFQSGNNYERYKGVCENYNKTIVCMEKLEGESCANQETFHVITSGLRYMCIEQRKAFEAVMECVDAQAAEVEKECELVCHVKERLAHWAVQSGILDNFLQTALSSLANGETFASNIFGRDAAGGLGGAFTGAGMHRMSGDGEGGLKQRAAAATAAAIKEAAKAAARRNRVDNGAASAIRPATGAGSGGGAAPRQLDFGQQNLAPAPPPLSKRLTPDFMRSIVQDGCELTRCQLICIRVKFDAKCGGSAGTLLSEAFVRPIAQAQEFLSYGSVAPFMGAFLPHQCDFMVKKEVLNEFRIPPELDEALHKKHDGEDEGKEVASMNEDGKGKKKATENAAENASNEPEKEEEANEPPEKAANASQSQLAVGKGKGRQMPPAAAANASSADQQQSGPAMPVVLVPGFSSPLDNTDYYEDVEEWESGAFNANAGQQQQKPQPALPQHPAPPPPAPVAPPQRKPQRPQQQQPQFQPPPQQQQGNVLAGREGTKQKTPEVEGGVYPGDLQRVSHVVGQTNTGGGGRRGRNRQ